MTKREAGAELRELGKEASTLLEADEPRGVKRLDEIIERVGALFDIIGVERML